MVSSENKPGVPLRILIIEDSEDDTQLVLREIRKGGYAPSFRRVQTANELRAVLAGQQWDLVISDFTMPEFDGLSALNILRESGHDIPFILVSGTISEENAVSSMRGGAQDFLTKFNLARLVPAINRELKEAEVRWERRRMQRELEDFYSGLEAKIKERTAELHASNQLSDAVNGINALIFSTTNIEEIMHLVVKETAKAAGADFAAIYMPEGNLWAARYVYGLAGLEGRYVTADDIRCSIIAARERRPVVINNITHNREICRLRILQEYEVKALLDVPLVAGKDVIGNFSLYSCSEEGVFREQQVDFLAKVSASISLAVKNARLFHEVKEAQERAAFFASAIENASQPFAAGTPDGRLTSFNRAFVDLTGYSAKELKSLTWAIDLTPPEWREHEARILEELQRTGKPQVYQKEYIKKNGSRVPIELKVQLVKDEDGRPDYYHAFVTDITDRKRMEEEIRHMAHHDPLTGLPNRRLFIDIVNIEREQARRHRNKMAILFMDLDRFKEINDTLGHDVGDQVLKETASRLESVLRRSDTIARIGGDEFNIILADLTRPEDTAEIARNIIESFRKPVSVNEHRLNITTSVGISIFPDDSEDIDTLLRFADIAMYHAKELGRNGYQFYNSSINVKSFDRMRLEAMLKHSLDLGEMEIFYQPLMDVSTRRVVGAEALARWRHPEKGLILPGEFISAAEETGFINELGEWSLKTVCRQMRAWLHAGRSPIGITVNLSALQFLDPELVEKVSSILTDTGVPPRMLGLEITETIAMSDVERSAARMKELSKMGIHIAIDDFGTGYSSLNYLKRLPVERLKIDKSFVHDIAVDPDDRSIVQAVTAMAHSMKMKVVAEGVETEEQLEFLRRTGCDEMQGFLYSEPLPAEEFTELLEAA